MLEKLSQIAWLKDYYGPLLTEKQRTILSLYYEDDFSLSEIGDDMQISRQAVYDLLKRSEHQLLQYEEKLGLVKKFQYARQQLEEACQLLDNENSDAAAVQRVKGILQEITDFL
jgi:predicted DNA-binding protein YlxM (UPF0122 family)